MTHIFRNNRFAQSNLNRNEGTPCVPDESATEVDVHGSPVSTRPSEWFVCFVPGLQRQWWHRFTHPKHKHVFALKTVGEGQWVIYEPWWNRIMVTGLWIDEAVKFLRWGATGSILRVREQIPGDGSQARGWANCAVQISLMLGRPYWCWTPHGLYRRLAAECGVERVDLTEFLETTITSATQKIISDGLGHLPALLRLEPEAALMNVAERISNIMFSPRYLALPRFAVSEGSRFPTAAAAFFTHGPLQVKTAVSAVVSHHCRAAERIHDCELEKLSQAFLSLLRGNLHLEAVLGCETEPSQADLTAREVCGRSPSPVDQRTGAGSEESSMGG
ncbi:TetR/AcrR family transcriptional regulator C-terminal domain-containing protein [Occallatibacter riparius]|uniref:TetR/AcrR family transcriptional regulator C-terminal domain-containing protein n=1 Tax=Occallatibacter riparius TaxID=1002689 RepID=A0A9J7BNR3_9BACT|nr:TetR/AcrR family transcriptional regulator C-terminal domain-containing protein [Occallatibacter riparius]UWZ84371.1 TetR/AcrR family transcriptional regulator C-terminal domain-containing protein [Occallatibacter riparius]